MGRKRVIVPVVIVAIALLAYSLRGVIVSHSEDDGRNHGGRFR